MNGRDMQRYEPDFNPHQVTSDGIRAFYTELQGQGCPVVHSDANGGFYTLTSYPDVREAASDWETFSSAGGITLPRQPVRLAPIEYDPPEHTFWRNLMKEVMTVKAVRAVEATVRRDAGAIIDGFSGRGNAELVAELAAIIPGNTICNLIGVTEPARIELGCHLGLITTESNGDPVKQEQAFGAFVGFVMEEIGARRAEPRADFLSKLANEEIEGRRLTDQEVVGLVIGFFFAGHHTTTAGLASLFSAIAGDPKVRDALIADRTLIPRAAEETLRLQTPLHGFFRQTTTDVEVHGAEIPQGSEVWLNYAAANRDPNVFDRPDEFVFDRKSNPHFGYGHGIHFCVGAPLARMEMRAVTEELLLRIPDLTLSDKVEYGWDAGNIMALTRVPVKFTPVSLNQMAPVSV
jgi:cytochrome P450